MNVIRPDGSESESAWVAVLRISLQASSKFSFWFYVFGLEHFDASNNTIVALLLASSDDAESRARAHQRREASVGTLQNIEHIGYYTIFI